MHIDDILQDIRDAKSRRDLLVKQEKEERARAQKAESDRENYVAARTVIQKVALHTQKELEYKFSNIVTTALAAVFDEPYEFIARFVERRNKMECDLMLHRDGVDYGITDTVGGGVVDIVAFAIRIAYWSLRKNRSVFILDEPFRNLSPNYHPKASEMLKMLSTKMKLQFIMVSHQKGMIEYADKIFDVSNGTVKEL